MYKIFLKIFWEICWEILWEIFWEIFSSSNFGLVWFSCIPSFNLLLCLDLVKKFTVVGGGWVDESNFSVTFGPNLKTKTLLRPRPKLNNYHSSPVECCCIPILISLCYSSSLKTLSVVTQKQTFLSTYWKCLREAIVFNREAILGKISHQGEEGHGKIKK